NTKRIETTIDDCNRTGDKTGCITDQVMERSEQILRITEAAERCVGNDRVASVGEGTVRVGKQCPILFSDEESRTECIHTETLPKLCSQLTGQVLGEVGHGCLGSSITGYTCQWSQ